MRSLDDIFAKPKRSLDDIFAPPQQENMVDDSYVNTLEQKVQARPDFAERKTPAQMQKDLFNFEVAKARNSQEQSMLGKIVSAPLEDIPFLGRMLDSPEMAEARSKLPLGSPLLGQLASGEKYLESIPSEIGRMAQNVGAGSKPMDEIGRVGKALTGQSKAEFGDVGVAGGMPEGVATGVGLVASMGLPGILEVAKGAEKGVKKLATKDIPYLFSHQKLADDVVKQGEKFARSVGIKKVKRAGKISDIKKYQKDVIDSAEDIFKNKEAIKYTDLEGNVIGEGRAPKNLYEQGQAIEQRRKQVFNEYDKFVQDSTGQGLKIDANKIRQPLNKYVNKVDLSVAGGKSDVVNMASKIDGALGKIGELSPTQVQDLISDYGKSATQARLTGNIALSELFTDLGKQARSLIDDSIEKAGLDSAEYFALRNKYRMYKNVEKEVLAKYWQQYNSRSALGNLADAFSLGDVARGMVDVASGASGGAGNIAKGVVRKMGSDILRTVKGADWNLNKLYKKMDAYQKVAPVAGEVVEDVATRAVPKVSPTLGYEAQKQLPNLPRGAQRPQFRAGLKESVIDMPNTQGSGTMPMEAPARKPKASEINAQKKLAREAEKADPLIQEARKYKRAEDFVASRDVVYHGTDADFTKFDLEKIGTKNDEGFFGRGIYFSEDKAEAGYYGKNIKEYVLNTKNPFDLRSESSYENDIAIDMLKKITSIKDFENVVLSGKKSLGAKGNYERVYSTFKVKDVLKKYEDVYSKAEVTELSGGAKGENYVAQIKKPNGLTVERRGETKDRARKSLAYELAVSDDYIEIPSSSVLPKKLIDPRRFTEVLQKEGYDSVRAENEVVVFDPSQLKTTQQLTDLWNKANKT